MRAPRRALRVPLLLALLAAPGCGKASPPAPGPAAPPAAAPAAPARDPAAGAARAAEAAAAAEKAAAEKDAAAKEADARRAADRAEVLALLKGGRPGAEPAARAADLEEAARRAREFLAKWPGADAEGEVADGASGAEAEAKRCRAYADALARAQKALDGKEWKEAVDAADEALKILPREEARTVRLQALRGAAPGGMVLVPAGPALLGRKKETTAVAAFYIDRTEVTCNRFGEYLIAVRGPPVPGWIGYSPPAGKGEHPVVHVTGEQAAAFAKWAGKRLPTEIEWEKAARGTDGRIFPWGDAFDAGKGNFGMGGTKPAGGSLADASPFGVLDMGGNVAEFTVPVLGFRAPAGAQREEDRPRWVVRGGHWGGEKKPEDNAPFLRFPFKAGEQDAATGFRCAMDAR